MTSPQQEPELNYAIITGKVMDRGELRTTSLGIFVIHFRLENTVSPPPGSQEGQGKTYIVEVEAWGSLAERVERSVRNGMFVLVEGSIVSRSYIDRMKREQHRMAVKASEVTTLGT